VIFYSVWQYQRTRDGGTCTNVMVACSCVAGATWHMASIIKYAFTAVFNDPTMQVVAKVRPLFFASLKKLESIPQNETRVIK